MWEKFFLRLGWRRGLPSSSRDRSRTTGRKPQAAFLEPALGDEPEAMLVRIEEDRKSTVLFWLAIMSTLAGTISAVVEVSSVRLMQKSVRVN